MTDEQENTGVQERRRVNDYDAFAAAYSAENDGSLANAYYERPAMLALVGDVAGHSVLDVGCGSGKLSASLRDRGATVTGIDASAGMLELAEQRLGDDTELLLVDLNDPLPFDDETFDDAIASLVLHYLEDWTAALAEMRRVLKPGGRLFASVDHPFVAYTIQDPRPNYFANTSYEFEWEFGGRRVPMRFWRKSLQSMLDAFTSAGFRVASINEPQPAPEARELFPQDFEHVSTAPVFLFFALEAVQD
ncbi:MULTISPECIES: class I SAM-dependent methyltransferase [Prauserella salsuginis group]|uniref:Class I SAM-dependent methyltransferase n=1 Tax=Prauserella salsuginis TaxID=387889 RepID=A0ABW6FX76_9PSEU|nr:MULTISPECIES: class I SAM-dependent methyltransferase [Prauserella salsuginis group]MCR3720590.1 Methyltransferase domain-containing protein [Prauserella flava]MCR3733700.1 Methyltransferase domain-containing protein [Prauserella salsuginis]